MCFIRREILCKDLFGECSRQDNIAVRRDKSADKSADKSLDKSQDKSQDKYNVLLTEIYSTDKDSYIKATCI